MITVARPVRFSGRQVRPALVASGEFHPATAGKRPTHWLKAVLDAALFSLLMFSALIGHAQTVRFEVSALFSGGGTVFSSGRIYSTVGEGTGAMLAYVRSQYEWGAYFAPWNLLEWYGENAITYRVPPRQPDGYYNVPHTDHLPPAATPAAACGLIAIQFGGTVVNVRFQSVTGFYGGGQGRWWCEVFIPTFGVYTFDMQPYCNTPFIQISNDDDRGEWMCGGGWWGLVYSTDYGQERPDQCPAEGNPILPNSAQKVEYETDYDNGQLLRFKRSYGSQRTGIGTSAALTHSFSADLVGGSWSGFNRRADGTVLQWRSPSADTPYTTVVSGVYPNQAVRIISFSEPMSEQYDAAGRLLWRSYAHGAIHRLTYADGAGGYLTGSPSCVLPTGVDPPTQVAPIGALQCVTDPFGRQLNFFVDARSRITKLIDPAGQAIDYAYDEASSYVAAGMQPGNNLTSVRYPDAYVRRYHYNEPAHTTGANFAKALTGVSELVPPAADFTRFSTFAYDAQARAVLTERASGVMRHSLTYSPNQVSVTDPLGTVRTHTFSTVVQASRRESTQQPSGSGSSTCNDTLTYDARANITSRVDFNGNKTCYAYHATRNLETKRVEGLSASAVCSTVLSSPPATSRVISTEWHPYWRLQTRVAEPKRITTTVYNDNGAACAPTDALVDGRPIAVVCSRTEQATTDETGAAGFSAITTGTPRTSTYTYTSYGRMLTATDPNSKTTTYSYYADDDSDLGKRGNVSTITNAANHVTAYTDYNAHGQPTRIVDANGLITTHVYDVRLRLRSSTAASQVTLFDYHPAGHLTLATLPNGVTLTYGYDGAHRLTSVVDQKGNRIVYTLNGLGMRTGEEVRDPGGILVKNIARVADALNRVERVTGETGSPRGQR